MAIGGQISEKIELGGGTAISHRRVRFSHSKLSHSSVVIMTLGKNTVSHYHLNYFVDYHQIIGDQSDIPTAPSLEEEKLSDYYSDFTRHLSHSFMYFMSLMSLCFHPSQYSPSKPSIQHVTSPEMRENV